MQVRLHKNAKTTPKLRLQLREESQTKSVRQLTRGYNLSVDTVTKWKHQTDVEDKPSTPHRLQTTLTQAQEEVVVTLRRLLKRRGISKKPVSGTSSYTITNCLKKHWGMLAQLSL